MASTIPRPLRSRSRTNSGPVPSYRPDLSHTSAGWTTGIDTSCPPQASISSRKMFETLSRDRFARGR